MLKLVIKFIRFAIYNVFMYIRSLFWKRDNTIVLVGGWFGKKFADNSRYLFQYLSDNKKKLGLKNVVWVTHNKEDLVNLKSMGYEAYLMESKESIDYHKKAGIHIVCNSSSGNGDIKGEYSYGAIKINLWHGNGVKAVGYASNKFVKSMGGEGILLNLFRNLYKSCKLFRGLTSKGGWADCYYIATSEKSAEFLKENFLLSDRNIIISNYPRHCECNRLLDIENEIIDQVKKRKTVLYLPTFRTENSKFDLNEVLSCMSSISKKQDYLFIVKPHPASNINLNKNEDILVLPQNFDINVLIPYVSLLMTDYSSCAYDAMYFGKPVLYYIPDYMEYLNGNNGFLDDPEKYMIGEKIENIIDLENGIYTALEKSQINENYKALVNLLWDNNKGLEEIWNDIINRAEVKETCCG